MADKFDDLDFNGIDEISARKDEEFDDIDFSSVDEPKTAIGKIGKDIQSSVSDVAETGGDIVDSGIETAADFGAGMVQGSTLGASDEMGGALQVALGKLHGLIGDSPVDVDAKLKEQGFTGDLIDTSAKLYRQAQQEGQTDYEDIQERSPVASFGGELTGGILSGLATAGTGLVGAGRTAGKEALKTVLKKEGTKAAGKEALKRGGIEAAKAAPIGAVAGALTSQEGGIIGASEEEQEKLIADTIGGASFGALAGGAMSGAGSVAGTSNVPDKIGKKVKDVVEDTPYLRKIKAMFKMGQEGIDPRSEVEQGIKSGERISDVPLSQFESRKAEGLVGQVMNARQNLGKQVQKTLDDAASTGKVVDISNEVGDSLDAINQAYNIMPDVVKTPKGKKLIDRLMVESGEGFGFRKSEVGVDELNALIGDMDAFYSSLKTMRNRDSSAEFIMRQIGKFRKGVSDRLKNELPEYKAATERFREFNELVPETILAKERPTEMKNVFFGDLKSDQQKTSLFDPINKMMRQSTEESASADKVKSNMTQMLDNMRKFEQKEAARGITEDIGLKKASDIEKEILETADISDAMRGSKFSRSDTAAEGSARGILMGIAEGARGTGLSTANIAGRSTRSGILKKTSDLSKSVYKLPNDTLTQLADDMSSYGNPAISRFGEALRKGIESGSEGKKNAALFTIMQNPEARLFIRGEDIEEGIEE